jgi:spermidine synthase
MSRAGFPLVAAGLFSGAAALVYQVLWTRQITLLLGHTVAAVSTVLATFMGGLALGSGLAGRLLPRTAPATWPRAYALLELGIAGCALVLPFLLRTGLPPLVSSVILLLAPTLLMGATLPLLTTLAGGRLESAGRVAGTLYAANTVGALAGSLASVFVLLPRFGVWRSTLLAAALNAAAAALVWRWRPAEPSPTEKRKGATRAQPAAPETLPAPVVLAVIGLSGLGALADEVAWTRALVLLIGPTVYAFAFVLAAVITGIALGSAAAAALLPRGRSPQTALGVVEAAAAAASLAVVAAIGRLPVLAGEIVRSHADRVDRLMGIEFAGVLALLGVPCILFGAAFPIAVQLLARAAGGAGPAAARTYAWNTVGAVLGAVLAGFVVLPRFGIRATLLAAAGTHAVAAALALAGRTRARRWAPAALLAAFVLAAAQIPPWDRDLLSGGVYKYAVYAAPGRLEEELRAGELDYYREGTEVTVSVKRVGGTLSLAVDGKVDATSGGDMLTQRLLAHLPLLLHPSPKEACVIGLGSGVTAGSALAHSLRRLDAVEISPEVAEAARLFSRFNRGVLDDPRLALRVADGRNHLLRTDRRYDVIISEPSNPWMAGVSSLFTRDFFLLARARLAPGGVFCQWAHVYNMHPRDLRTVVGSFTDAFPAAALFVANEGDILLIGGQPALPTADAGALARRMAEAAVKDDLAKVEVRSASGLATLYALGGDALARFAGDAPRHTDDRPRLEFSAPRYLHADTARENYALILEAARNAEPPAPLAAFAGLGLAPSPAAKLERARMLERAGSPNWAMDLYREALAQARLEPEAYEGLVRTAIKSGRAAEAERFLGEQASGPAPVSARVALGLLHHNLNRPALALETLAAAAAADPRNVRARMIAAEVQQASGNVDAAEALVQEALSIAPDDTDAQGFLASVSLARGRLDEAIARADAVLARAPREPRALEASALARAQKGDRAGARRAFEALLEAEPDGWMHWTNFALLELESGDPRAAARLFHQSVSLNPGHAAGYRGLAEAARSLGDRALARRAESALRQFQPDVQKSENP